MRVGLEQARPNHGEVSSRRAGGRNLSVVRQNAAQFLSRLRLWDDAGGDLNWYRQDTNASEWSGPRKVGNGWTICSAIIPGGGNKLYCIRKSDGALLWFAHDGFNGGSLEWRGPNVVGSGWAGFHKVFGGSNGIIYAIKPDGTLLWYRNYGVDSGTPSWAGPTTVGSGWAGFTQVFSMGQGEIYAVNPAGALLWYKHTGYQNGAPTWQGPFTIAKGFDVFAKLVPISDGVILAIRKDGAMFWYRHVDHATGVSTGADGKPGLAEAPFQPSLFSTVSQLGAYRAAVAQDAPAAPAAGSQVIGTGSLANKEILAAKPGPLVSGAARRDPTAAAPSAAISAIQREAVVTASPQAAAAAKLKVGAVAHSLYNPHWQGPFKIGSGWQGYAEVEALLMGGDFVGPR